MKISRGLALAGMTAAVAGGVAPMVTAGIAAAADPPVQIVENGSGTALRSPGVVSGNVVQAPVHVPVNVCGNTVDVIGLLNPAFGNTCVNQ